MVGLAVLNSSNCKYELVNEINKENEKCIVILDRTIFYPESGGQQSDTGHLINTSNGLSIQVENVIHLQGYSFHIGKLLDKKPITLNDSVEIRIDNLKRYKTSMNHTGVHLLNHAIRHHFNNENSIIQLNSIVKDESLKFEFTFNQSLRQPNLTDIKSIEGICQDLINKSLNIYTSDTIRNNLDEIKLNYPVRKLKDVLYPLDLRIVSIGISWSDFTGKNIKSELESASDYSAELCCGTHASNTNQLKQFVITHLNVNGDSTFEIDALTSQVMLLT